MVELDEESVFCLVYDALGDMAKGMSREDRVAELQEDFEPFALFPLPYFYLRGDFLNGSPCYVNCRDSIHILLNMKVRRLEFYETCALLARLRCQFFRWARDRAHLGRFKAYALPETMVFLAILVEHYMRASMDAAFDLKQSCLAFHFVFPYKDTVAVDIRDVQKPMGSFLDVQAILIEPLELLQREVCAFPASLVGSAMEEDLQGKLRAHAATLRGALTPSPKLRIRIAEFQVQISKTDDMDD